MPADSLLSHICWTGHSPLLTDRNAHSNVGELVSKYRVIKAQQHGPLAYDSLCGAETLISMEHNRSAFGHKGVAIRVLGGDDSDCPHILGIQWHLVDQERSDANSIRV